jgi:hypothetical protein
MSIDIEKNLYRIIQGRLRYKVRDGLVLYIQEPTPELIYDSHEIYDDVYNECYWKGIYVQEEIIPILLENDYWSPHDDREAERLQKEIDQKKVEAFQNFVKKKILRNLKMQIYNLEKKWHILLMKRGSLDHVTCSGCAELARTYWLISKTTYCNGELYDWSDCSITDAANFKAKNPISETMYRRIARSEVWRGMWSSGKGTNIFGVPFSRITKQQARLCMYAKMYDNVHESPEAPSDKLIEDDICLDGWFIHQRKKHEKQKKANQVDGMIGNDKIRNAGEVFVMAEDKQDAGEIYDLNDGFARGTIKQREAQLKQSEGQINFTELADVKQDIEIQRTQKIKDHYKGMR